MWEIWLVWGSVLGIILLTLNFVSIFIPNLWSKKVAIIGELYDSRTTIYEDCFDTITEYEKDEDSYREIIVAIFMLLFLEFLISLLLYIVTLILSFIVLVGIIIGFLIYYIYVEKKK